MDEVYEAEEVWEEVYEESFSSGAYSQDELEDLLWERGGWTQEDDDLWARLPKDLEDAKVRLFEALFQEKEQEILRRIIKKAKEETSRLTSKRSQFDEYSAEGQANQARARYVVALTLRKNGKRVYSSKKIWRKPIELVDQIIIELHKVRITEEVYRDLAQNDPWLTQWNAKKSGMPVFPGSASELSQEQSELVKWTNIYASILDCPDRPSQAVIDDHDMLEGWLIKRKREQDAQEGKREVDSVLQNEKIRNSGEVYVFTDNAKKARTINDMNSARGKSIVRSRHKAVQKEGRIDHTQLPDVKQEIQIQINRRKSNG